MEHLRLTKVNNVLLMNGKKAFLGTLHLTAHHLIFRYDTEEELWVFYSMVHQLHRHPLNLHNQITLDLHCRHFLFLRFLLSNESQANDVYDSLNKLIHISSIEQLYAFIFWPSIQFQINGWNYYQVEKEHARQLTNLTFPYSKEEWRFTSLNETYELCPTYPKHLIVPTKISDHVLKYAVKHRSKMRFPALTYLHSNGTTLTRCSQPLVGVKNHRSLQDEKLTETLFSMPTSRPNQTSSLIIDARPTTNAMANTAKGAGTENMEYYKFARKVFMGIENIHVMRESLSKMMEVFYQSFLQGTPPSLLHLEKSDWSYHIKLLLESTFMIVDTLHVQHAHVLIHCSDGWDRTAQLVSLTQVCLDPYYRTLEGFLILIEKDWLSFGHKFSDRCGHPSTLSSSSSSSSSSTSSSTTLTSTTTSITAAGQEEGKPINAFQKMQHFYYHSIQQREISPIFHQFLDAVYQLRWQYPHLFEFNDTLLSDLQFHSYSGQLGSFLMNSEKERLRFLAHQTHSMVSFFLHHASKYTNPSSLKQSVLNSGVLLVNPPFLSQFQYWIPKVEGMELPMDSPLVVQFPITASAPSTLTSSPLTSSGVDATSVRAILSTPYGTRESKEEGGPSLTNAMTLTPSICSSSSSSTSTPPTTFSLSSHMQTEHEKEEGSELSSFLQQSSKDVVEKVSSLWSRWKKVAMSTPNMTPSNITTTTTSSNGSSSSSIQRNLSPSSSSSSFSSNASNIMSANNTNPSILNPVSKETETELQHVVSHNLFKENGMETDEAKERVKSKVKTIEKETKEVKELERRLEASLFLTNPTSTSIEPDPDMKSFPESSIKEILIKEQEMVEMVSIKEPSCLPTSST